MIVPYYFVDLIAAVSQAMIIFVAVNGLCRTIRMEYLLERRWTKCGFIIYLMLH